MSNWSDDDIESTIHSALILSVCVLVGWFLFRPQNAQRQEIIHNRQAPRRGEPVRAANQNVNRNNNASRTDDNEISHMLAMNTRSPPHTSSTFNVSQPHEGIIPFRNTLASTFESRVSSSIASTPGANESAASERQIKNRKERAKIFTRLFSSTRTDNGSGSTPMKPPSRGSSIVVTIPLKEVGCVKLRRVLFLLGSYYNLFILVQLSKEDIGTGDGKTDSEEYARYKLTMKEIEQKLRGDATSDSPSVSSIEGDGSVLPVDVLPSHRVVAVTSVSGRVAFIRQLPKQPEFILDYESEVRKILERFGFTVLLYTAMHGNENEEAVSGIGQELLS